MKLFLAKKLWEHELAYVVHNNADKLYGKQAFFFDMQDLTWTRAASLCLTCTSDTFIMACLVEKYGWVREPGGPSRWGK